MPERARILATDDRPEILRLIERTLGERYDCEFAADVEAARAKLADSEFELALCDIEMPGESGLTLAEEISSEHPETAVVLVTGVDDPGIANRAFEFGAYGYLVKPFWPGQLLITTMSALRRRELEIAAREHSRDLEERLRVVMDRAPISVFLLDRERRFVLANRVAHEGAGREPGEMIGLHSSDVMSAETESRLLEADREILDRGSTFELEETLHFGGRDRTFLTVKFPYVGVDGEIAGIYGIAHDITDKKQAEVLREEMTQQQQLAIDELEASRLETVDRLTKAIEHHDAETGEHVSRMATIAAFLASLCGLDRANVQLLRAAAPMHDVGKVATPDAILTKPGALSTAERAVMEQHTTVGFEILSGSESELLQMAARIALTHHERWDGSGYPQGLRGEEIPIEGRIVAVADVFDALLSDRSYRRAMPLEEVVEVMREGIGTHFDPVVAKRLLENLEEALELRG